MPLDIEKVKQKMFELRIHQKDLAFMCGVTEGAMSRYLAGTRQPKSETLANMATALNTTSNELLGLTRPTETNEIIQIIARNASSIPQDVKLKLIQLLSSSK